MDPGRNIICSAVQLILFNGDSSEWLKIVSEYSKKYNFITWMAMQLLELGF